MEKKWMTLYDALLLFLSGVFTTLGLFIGIMYLSWGFYMFGSGVILLIALTLFAIVRRTIFNMRK